MSVYLELRVLPDVSVRAVTVSPQKADFQCTLLQHPQLGNMQIIDEASNYKKTVPNLIETPFSFKTLLSRNNHQKITSLIRAPAWR